MYIFNYACFPTKLLFALFDLKCTTKATIDKLLQDSVLLEGTSMSFPCFSALHNNYRSCN